MSSKPDNYVEEVPDHVDMSQDEWLELGYDSQYYHANPDRKEQNNRNQRRRREEKTGWLREQKAERGCCNCGENNPVCLDWHHRDEKEYELSNMAQSDFGYERMEEEIKDCVVICANCHRKLHHGELELDRKI